MSDPVPQLVGARKTGAEPLHRRGAPLQHDLLSFWQWSGSDLVSNTARGRFAEFLVATALGVDTGGVRAEWDAFDLTTPSGTRIEVKSAAYVQTWHQKGLSKIAWRLPPTRAWDSTTGLLSAEVRRQADVYVLALLHHPDKNSVDPLDVEQWTFFAIPTRVLDARTRSQHSIALASVERLSKSVSYDDLRAAVDLATAAQRGTS